MELRDYLSILRRRWWQIALVALLTLAVAIGASEVIPTKWESHVTLRILPSSGGTTAYDALLTADLLAKTYRQLIDSDYIAILAMRRLRVANETVEQFRKHVTVELVPDTELVQVTASAQDPTRARDYAQAVANASIDYVQQAGLKDSVSIAIPALLPDKPIWPNRNVAGSAGLSFGLALGVALALMFEFLGARLENPAEVEEKLNLPVIGRIPRISGLGQFPVVFNEPHSPLAEDFRHLRTAILYSMDGHKLDALLVTSAEPGQGKSAVTANLSISLAKTGKQVLLVDADMRLPTMHQFFGVENNKGLAEFLRGDMTLKQVAQPSGFDSLTLVTAGARPEEPSELLGSVRLSEFLKQARACADIVLIDSPPAVTVTDSVVLAARVDGVLLVVQKHQRLDTVRRAKSVLSRVGAQIIGTVFNRADSEHQAGGRSGYYYQASRKPAAEPPAPSAAESG
jgi:polysaccharide biosynthesis transport protein